MNNSALFQASDIPSEEGASVSLALVVERAENESNNKLQI
jgi:hypothetical protein